MAHLRRMCSRFIMTAVAHPSPVTSHIATAIAMAAIAAVPMLGARPRRPQRATLAPRLQVGGRSKARAAVWRGWLCVCVAAQAPAVHTHSAVQLMMIMMVITIICIIILR